MKGNLNIKRPILLNNLIQRVQQHLLFLLRLHSSANNWLIGYQQRQGLIAHSDAFQDLFGHVPDEPI